MKKIKTADYMAAPAPSAPTPTGAGAPPTGPGPMPGATGEGAPGLQENVQTLTMKVQQIAQMPLINSEDAATFLRIGNFMMSEGSAMKKKAQDFLKQNPAA